MNWGNCPECGKPLFGYLDGTRTGGETIRYCTCGWDEEKERLAIAFEKSDYKMEAEEARDGR